VAKLKGMPIPRNHKARLAFAALSGWPTCEDCLKPFEPYVTEYALSRGDDKETCHRCWHLWLVDVYDFNNATCETCQRVCYRGEFKGRWRKHDRQ
jgi:hypothetical protein